MHLAQKAAGGLGSRLTAPPRGSMAEPWWRLRGQSLQKCFGFLTFKRHTNGLKQHSKITTDGLTNSVIY